MKRLMWAIWRKLDYQNLEGWALLGMILCVVAFVTLTPAPMNSPDAGCGKTSITH